MLHHFVFYTKIIALVCKNVNSTDDIIPRTGKLNTAEGKFPLGG